MSNADASERSEAASKAARARWEQEGNPVVARSVLTVVERAGELSDVQRAVIVAALTGEDPP